MKEIRELIEAAKDGLHVFDGLSDAAWKVYKGAQRKERIEKAIVAAERLLNQ